MLATWALFAIIHIVGFPVIWSASTGYVSPTAAYLQFPDGSSLPLSSSNMTDCVSVLDGSRIGLEDGLMVTGGQVSIQVDGARVDDPSANPQNEENFGNIFRCKDTSSDLLAWLMLNIIDIADALNLILTAESKTSFANAIVFPPGYSEPYQTQNISMNGSMAPDLIGQFAWLFNETSALGPGVVPYDSSLVLDGKTHFIYGSLLRFTNNSMCTDILPDCYNPKYINQTCINGQPLPTNWSPQAFCASDSGFVWGFSHLVTMLCLVFEITWAVTSHTFWFKAHRDSVLLQRGLDLSNIYENAIYLASIINETLKTEDKRATRK